VKLNELMLYRELNREGSIPTLAEWELEQLRARELKALEAAVLEAVTAAPGIQFHALRRQLLPTFFGRVRWGAYSKAVKNLVKGDMLVREERKGAALRENERLQVAGAASTQAATAA
jgi:hypothetical protein